MKTYKITIKKIFLLCSFFYFLNVAAQAPNKMSYQAVVRNTAGILVANANVGIQISILQTTATGTGVFIERHTTPTNANGLATLEIGVGTNVFGTIKAIDWANGPYFIKTETDPTGGTNYTISGTSQMLSAPYALFAANTWGTNGNNATNTTFLGTTNNTDVVFKRNGIEAGRISELNASFGHRALESNIALNGVGTGINNTAIGVSALLKNTDGSDNTATGTAALSDNTIGNYNTAFGSEALSSNTTGNDNTASGYAALRSNITGSLNTATGKSALYTNTTGSSNTANGYFTLVRNTIGNNNSATGRNALNNNTIGNNNTAMGFGALDANTTGENNTANGVGSLDKNIVGNSNTAIGRDALFNSTGNNNTAVGRGALSGVTTGINNTAIGFDAQIAVPTNSNQVRIGNGAVALASVQVAWTTTSDNRWKSNIQKSNLGLDFIKQLNPVFYTRKDVQDNEGKPKILETTTNPTTEYGFIAQELESTLNKFNAKNNGIISKDDAGMLGVRYNDLLAPMVKAMQEQQMIIEELKARILALEK